MDALRPSDGTLLWEVIGESFVPAWCFLKVEDDGAHVVRFRLLHSELGDERFPTRSDAAMHAEFLLADLVRHGFRVVPWTER